MCAIFVNCAIAIQLNAHVRLSPVSMSHFQTVGQAAYSVSKLLQGLAKQLQMNGTKRSANYKIQKILQIQKGTFEPRYRCNICAIARTSPWTPTTPLLKIFGLAPLSVRFDLKLLLLTHRCVYSQTWEIRPPKGLGISGPIFQVVSFARLGSKIFKMELYT